MWNFQFNMRARCWLRMHLMLLLLVNWSVKHFRITDLPSSMSASRYTRSGWTLPIASTKLLKAFEPFDSNISKNVSHRCCRVRLVAFKISYSVSQNNCKDVISSNTSSTFMSSTSLSLAFLKMFLYFSLVLLLAFLLDFLLFVAVAILSSGLHWSCKHDLR